MSRHRETARAVVVHEGRVLLMERMRPSKSKKNKGEIKHYFSIPGGGIEKHESSFNAAERELYEEMAVRVHPVRELGKYVTNKGEKHKFILAEYVAGDPALHPDSSEAKNRKKTGQEYIPRWVTREELENGHIELHKNHRSMLDVILRLMEMQGGAAEDVLSQDLEDVIAASK